MAEFPDVEGCLLWQLCRDTYLWAETDPRQRTRLFAEGAGRWAEESLSRVSLFDRTSREPVSDLIALLYPPVGAESNQASVAQAALAIGAWAYDRGCLRSAVSFAIAGWAASPSDPHAALLVGRYSFHAGHRRQAETWVKRAIDLARRTLKATAPEERARKAYAEARLELGRVLAAVGDDEGAKEQLWAAIAAARRWGELAVRGRAHGELFLIAQRSADEEGIEWHSKRACRAFPKGHPERIVHAIRRAELLVRTGRATEWAVRTIHRGLTADQSVEQQIATLVLLIRGLGQLKARHILTSEEALATPVWAAATNAIASLGQSSTAAQFGMDIAEACAASGMVDRALEAARFALSMASRAREHQLEERARSLLSKLGSNDGSPVLSNGNGTAASYAKPATNPPIPTRISRRTVGLYHATEEEVLSYLYGLELEGHGFFIGRRWGWATWREVAAELMKLGTTEALQEAHRRGLVSSLSVELPGTKRIYAYRITDAGTSKIPNAAAHRRVKAVPPDAVIRPRRPYLPGNIPATLLALNLAARADAGAAEPAWRSSQELSEILDAEKKRLRQASVMFSTEDLQWCVKARLADRTGERRHIGYRVTPAGRAVTPLTWNGPRPGGAQ